MSMNFSRQGEEGYYILGQQKQTWLVILTKVTVIFLSLAIAVPFERIQEERTQKEERTNLHSVERPTLPIAQFYFCLSIYIVAE